MTNHNRSGSGYCHAYLETMENRTLLSGGLDPTFGVGGILATHGAGNQTFTSQVAITANRSVVAGEFAYQSTHLELYRYLANGSPDLSFGAKGVAQAAFGSREVQSVQLTVQSNGEIIAGVDLGIFQASQGTWVDPAFAIIRFNTNGSIDKTFGQGGTVTFDNQQNRSIVMQQNKLLVDGTTIERLNADGTVDGSFHKIDATFGGTEAGAIVAVQPNLDILVDTNDDTIYRYSPAGILDKSFGVSGAAQAAQNGSPVAVVTESNGTIVELAGPGFPHGIGPSTLTALNANGSPDLAFGTAGSVTISGSPANGPQQAATELIQTSGNQLLVVDPWRTAPPGPGSMQGVNITRYSGSGAADKSFGANGSVLVPYNLLSLPTNYPYSLSGDAALDSAGRLVLMGYSDSGGPTLFAIDTNNNDTGTITGQMFNDTNGNGKYDKGETALNWTCYIDVDNDGKFDNADIRVYTNKQGVFSIPNLPAGTYHIRQSGVAHWQKTTPAVYTVVVKVGQTISGINFGSRFIG